MFRDGLLRLPDALIVGDFTCPRADCILLSVCLSFSLAPVFLYLVYDSFNKYK